VVTVQRAIEMTGIPTVVITVEPAESAQARPSRALAPLGWTVGHSLGRPNDAALQQRVVMDALELLVTPHMPGTIVERMYDSAPEPMNR
jgi:hypothetical protein